ncbi:MAG: prepilin peptidase [Phycisphaerae bacterium]|nr:prepilin peptidase [Phycisphaerae bacterium]
MTPEGVWLIFLFAFGSCIGSFLNVVIYRLPRDKSIVSPPSSCPSCNRRIPFYYNIPLVSWILLRGKCRYCRARISPRYFVIELMTGVLFVAVYVLFFVVRCRELGIDAPVNAIGGMGTFLAGGWLFYVALMILLSAFLAASAIDLELWVIPLSLCWFVTAAGMIASAAAPFVMDGSAIRSFQVFPVAGALTGAMATGATIGLMAALLGLLTGRIKRSYEYPEGFDTASEEEPDFNHRLEALREIVFLSPVIAGAAIGYLVFEHVPAVHRAWVNVMQQPAIAGLLGSAWGYLVGCGVVWATRILGTLAFGKEAMGLGDVHLMGAAGAVIGAVPVVLAFFIAPFFGLAWAMYQTIFRKTRQIPYGPFLSMAVFVVIIFHDWFRAWIAGLYFYQ